MIFRLSSTGEGRRTIPLGSFRFFATQSDARVLFRVGDCTIFVGENRHRAGLNLIPLNARESISPLSGKVKFRIQDCAETSSRRGDNLAMRRSDRQSRAYNQTTVVSMHPSLTFIVSRSMAISRVRCSFSLYKTSICCCISTLGPRILILSSSSSWRTIMLCFCNSESTNQFYHLARKNETDVENSHRD